MYERPVYPRVGDHAEYLYGTIYPGTRFESVPVDAGLGAGFTPVDFGGDDVRVPD